MARELIDTRNRSLAVRRDSIFSSSSSPPPKRTPRRSTDLGAILSPCKIPNYYFRVIQDTLNTQDRIITERNREIQEQNDHIHRLERDLAKSRQEAADYLLRYQDVEKQLEDAELSKTQPLSQQCEDRSPAPTAQLAVKTPGLVEGYPDAVSEMQQHIPTYGEDSIAITTVLSVGTRILAEQTQKVDALSQQVHKLQSSVAQRDSTIGTLKEKVVQLTMAPPDEWARLAVEDQAERTLSMLKGLQKDVTDRDAKIADLQANVRVVNEKTIDLRREIKSLKEGQAMAKAKDEESQSILAEQSKLIQELLASLAKHGGA